MLLPPLARQTKNARSNQTNPPRFACHLASGYKRQRRNGTPRPCARARPSHDMRATTRPRDRDDDPPDPATTAPTRLLERAARGPSPRRPPDAGAEQAHGSLGGRTVRVTVRRCEPATATLRASNMVR
ncbi:Os03g0232101 [Oryza sativa Japonica Group]|uniref:Os03g0232101 protein n=2 Tax=Oryza sativa subsp. japonica TaxID=39947 RepID=C7J0L2_ORYSJ|nr:hypothetical protein EE612_016305 [Oryza sativa]KAF2938179.1 hypothetical protein DAI22_03g099900 [Oryza sativa Japonica Group]BAH92060.1 Os03g0232101 [Oryza sativa Japonica Group]BAS83115.1 Os03g0232101 [Oryza sativa Japonica Group]|eukprot:NP_001173332.1 Os03g0232101 [Oryza sativa Japonica Group]